MQLEMGMSTRRYLPASGTAGLARSLVSGNSLVPCPPPMITESTLLVFNDCLPVCDIKNLSRPRAANIELTCKDLQAGSPVAASGSSRLPLRADDRLAFTARLMLGLTELIQ